jgi:hypothetical protein
MTAPDPPAQFVQQDVTLPLVELRTHLGGAHACIAGSAVAALEYGLHHSWDDIDVFAYGNSSLISIANTLLERGFVFASDNEAMKYDRWLAWDMNVGWRTNSVKLKGCFDKAEMMYEVNVVYKQFEKQPVKRLSMVLESFDFGHLAMGYELRTDELRDMREFFFPHAADFKALPMLPDRHDRWELGLITQYTGIRQAGRAVKYMGYGYDLSNVVPTLITGYRIAAGHHAGHFDPEKVVLGQIYDRLADHLENGEHDKIVEADRLLPQWRDVDAILERLD